MTFQIDRNCVERLKQDYTLYFDSSCRQFTTSCLYFSSAAKETAKNLAKYLREANSHNSLTERDQLLQEAATIFLDRNISWYQGSLDQGLAACKDDPFLMNLIRIDRYLASLQFRNREGLNEDEVLRCFRTRGARDELRKWLDEPTRNGKKARTNERVIGANGALAFLKHPDQVDFVKEHRLEKYAGTRNDHIRVNPRSQDLLIRHEGEYRSITWLQDNLVSDRKRLYTKDGTRVFYKDRLGLAVCRRGDPLREDPEHFEVLPIYKTKQNRKHSDFRIEICSATSDSWTDGNHGWLVLKNPQGEVRSFGFFWREGNEPHPLRMFDPEIGEFHADGDRYDYLRVEDKVQKTKIQIDQATHDSIIKSVEEFQNDWKNRTFNPVSQNCCWFIHNIVKKHLGYDLPIRGTLLDAFLGINIRKNFFIKHIPPIRIAAFLAYYISSVIRNFVYLFMGARFWGPKEKRMFRSFFDLFNPKMGMPYHPGILQRWQLIVEEIRKKNMDQLKEDMQSKMENASIVERRNLEAQLNREMEKLQFSLPKEALPEKPSLKDYFLDIFFPVLEEDRYFGD